MVKNEAGEFYDLSLTTCFLTSEKHSFDVHTDKSPKICTHVEQISLYQAGQLLSIDVTVPFFKSKNIAKNCVSIQCTPHCQGVSVSPTNQIPAFIIPPAQRSCWGVYWFHSVRPSVRPSHMPCPLGNIYSSGWILSILGTNNHYHERVCRAPWPLTLTYIFKVIWPWLRKSCPLCSIYSSGWILFIFSTNVHYH